MGAPTRKRDKGPDEQSCWGMDWLGGLSVLLVQVAVPTVPPGSAGTCK